MTTPSNNSLGMDESSTFTSDIRRGLTADVPEEYHSRPHSITPYARSWPQGSSSVYHPAAPLATVSHWDNDSAADQEFTEHDEALLASLEEQFGESQPQSEQNHAQSIERELLDQAALYEDDYENPCDHHHHYDDYTMEGTQATDDSYAWDSQHPHHHDDRSQTAWDSAQMNLNIDGEEQYDATQGSAVYQEPVNAYQGFFGSDQTVLAPLEADSIEPHVLSGSKQGQSMQKDLVNRVTFCEGEEVEATQGSPANQEPVNAFQGNSGNVESYLEDFGELQFQSEPTHGQSIKTEMFDQEPLVVDDHDYYYGLHHDHHLDYPLKSARDTVPMDQHIACQEGYDFTQGSTVNQEFGTGHHEHPGNDKAFLTPIQSGSRRVQSNEHAVPYRVRSIKRAHMESSDSHHHTRNPMKMWSAPVRRNEGQQVLSSMPPYQKDSWNQNLLHQPSSSARVSDLSARTSSAAPPPLSNSLSPNLTNLLHAEVKKNAYIDTQILCKRVETEIERHSIPREEFAQIILGRSEQVLSQLLQNPMPWNKMRSGRYPYRRMHNWLLQPLATKLAFFEMQGGAGSSESSVPEPTQPKIAHPIPSQYWPEPRKMTPGQPAPKRARVNFTDEQKKTLEAIFQEMAHPPKEKQHAIAESLGLDASNVINYFKNARRRKTRSKKTNEPSQKEQVFVDFGPNDLEHYNF